MNRSDIVIELQKKARISKNEATKVVFGLFDQMADTLADGDRIELRGFCSFYVKDYKAYFGHNPQNGDPVLVPTKKLPFFKVGKELLARVNR